MKHSNRTIKFPRTTQEAFGPHARWYTPPRRESVRLELVMLVVTGVVLGSIMAFGI